MSLLVMLLALGASLAACGLKGDLYLPEPAAGVAPATGTTPPAAATPETDGEATAD